MKFNIWFAAVPPTTMFEVEEPVRVPYPKVGPFRVSVLEPITRLPAVSVNVPKISKDVPSVTVGVVPVRLTVKLFNERAPLVKFMVPNVPFEVLLITIDEVEEPVILPAPRKLPPAGVPE